MKLTAEQEAVNWIIRNNHQIVAKLEENELKEVLIEAFLAGKASVEPGAIDPDKLFTAVQEQMDEDQLTSYSHILVKNL
jgi:hypothetical protein